MDGSWVELFALLAAAGAVAGVAAGLFGIGGGVVIVPALYYAFQVLGADDAVRMHAAIGTSLAVIIITSIRSVLAHHKRGAVDVEVLKAFAPWLALGAVAGAVSARFVPGPVLTVIFAVGMLGVGVRTALKASGRKARTDGRLPTGGHRRVLGAGMGLASAWMGIGGGMLGVMVMTMAGRPIHQAVATSAGFGAAIGVPGAIGYGIAGLGVAGLPAASIGYVNLPGLAAVAAATTLTAPLGARLAHSLSQRLLSYAFAALALGVATRMLWESARQVSG